MNSWFEIRLPTLGDGDGSLEDHKDYIENLFVWLLEPATYFIFENCITPVPITPQELVLSLTNLLNCLYDFTKTGVGSDVEKALEALFVQAVIWTIGACINQDGRMKFDNYMRQLCTGKGEGISYHDDFLSKNPWYAGEPRTVAAEFPALEKGTVFDFCFDPNCSSSTS